MTRTLSGIARRRWRDQDVEIAYERLGEAGEPLLLLAGQGGQRFDWRPEFCSELLARGFEVIRFDQRDTGASTRFDHLEPPRDLLMWLRPSAAAVYTLDDLADDAVSVLDDAGWGSAHLVGMSLGAATAQVVATRHPVRVRSLTSIAAGPAPRIGMPRPGTVLRMVKALGAPVPDAASLAQQLIALDAIVGSPGCPTDTERLRALAVESFPGRASPAAIRRQTAAVAAGGDRRAQLAAVTSPTLVVHGGSDPVCRPVAGRATAKAIPGARLRTFPGMGHGLPRELWGEITDAIVGIAGPGPTAGR
ncbi:alpha/beta fold hydrolase [Pseudonocardia sp. DLS-67]